MTRKQEARSWTRRGTLCGWGSAHVPQNTERLHAGASRRQVSPTRDCRWRRNSDSGRSLETGERAGLPSGLAQGLGPGVTRAGYRGGRALGQQGTRGPAAPASRKDANGRPRPGHVICIFAQGQGPSESPPFERPQQIPVADRNASRTGRLGDTKTQGRVSAPRSATRRNPAPPARLRRAPENTPGRGSWNSSLPGTCLHPSRRPHASPSEPRPRRLPNAVHAGKARPAPTAWLRPLT